MFQLFPGIVENENTKHETQGVFIENIIPLLFIAEARFEKREFLMVMMEIVI